MSSLKVSKRNCPIWDKLITEAYGVIDREPNLEDFFQKAILGFEDIESSISYVLADQLQQNDCDLEKTQSIIYNALIAEPDIYEKISKDITCTKPLIVAMIAYLEWLNKPTMEKKILEIHSLFV